MAVQKHSCWLGVGGSDITLIPRLLHRYFVCAHQAGSLGSMAAEQRYSYNTVKEEQCVFYYPQSKKWICRVTEKYHKSKDAALVALSTYRIKMEDAHLQKAILRNNDGVAVIPVKQGAIVVDCFVDDEWWHILIKTSWTLNAGGYPSSPTMMHLVIMTKERQPGLVVDHINGNRLDNRRVNLRMATYSQNAQNKVVSSKRSLPRGVTFLWNRFYVKSSLAVLEAVGVGMVYLYVFSICMCLRPVPNSRGT
jgi:hypothetical protein